MSLRVLIVPDKFKGTLTAQQVAAAIAKGWRDIRPDDFLEELPMADGGDGFGEILGQVLNAQPQHCTTVDAAGHRRVAEWWLAAHSHVALVETAQVIGLALLTANKYHPFHLDTFGIGAVFKQAAQSGVRRLYVGVGGSATNDGGFGLARALGWRFWDATGSELITWTTLDRLERVEAPSHPVVFDDLIVAVDVNNPLLGVKGASRVFGPQKGLQKEADILHAEACLARLAEVLSVFTGEDYSLHPGAGSAGGLGFGLSVFCGGKIQSGGEIFAALSQLDQRIQNADVVITAEGALDAQTLMGKGVGVVVNAAVRAGKQCFCLAGSVTIDPASVTWPNFKAFAIVPNIASIEESTAHADDCLRRLARLAARDDALEKPLLL